MRDAPGFLSAWIAEDAGGVVACVLWESREAADAVTDLRDRAQGLFRATEGEAPHDIYRRYMDVSFHLPASER